MKIYNTNNKCEEEQTISDQPTTLINNIGLTYPGTAMPLRPLTLNEHNSIRGINQMGLNVINPHYGYNATGCCGNDTLVVKGNLSITGDFTFGEWGRFHDVSANWVQYYNHSSFFTWGVHIIPKSGTLFTLAMRGLHTNPHYHVHWDHQTESAMMNGYPSLHPDADGPDSGAVTAHNWAGKINQDTTAYTNNDRGDRPTSGNNPDTSAPWAANTSPQRPDPNYTGNINTPVGADNIDPGNAGNTGNAGGHNHTFTGDDCDGGHYGNIGNCTSNGSNTAVGDHSHNMQHNHDLFQHTHEHDHKLNEDKCNNTHDHYIKDETRVWYEGWLYPGFGGYGNSTQSLGYKTAANGDNQLTENSYGTGGGAGTDYDPSHNLKAYGASHDDGGNAVLADDQTMEQDYLFQTMTGTSSTTEFTGWKLAERPRLGGWSDRSSFPSCSFKGGNNFEYGMAIATSIPFDGWLINDASGSPFRNNTTWPHGGHSHSHCHPCDQIEHHEHPGPSSRFSWMLGKYDTGSVSDNLDFVLTIEFYIICCDPEVCGVPTTGLAAPEKIGTATIRRRCGCAKWGDGVIFNSTDETVTIKAGDGIGMFVKSNNDANGDAPKESTGSLHSPATFTLEVHRKY